MCVRPRGHTVIVYGTAGEIHRLCRIEALEVLEMYSMRGKSISSLIHKDKYNDSLHVATQSTYYV